MGESSPYIDGDYFPVVVIKKARKGKEGSKSVADKFEDSLGGAVKRLGTVTKTVRRTGCLRNDCIPGCDRCSSYDRIEYNILGISWPLEEIKEAAEDCKLIVPMVQVEGLIPTLYDRHWLLRILRDLLPWTNTIAVSEDAAKHCYTKQLDAKFDRKVMDKFTRTPFSSAHYQLLTVKHLNSSYRTFKETHATDKPSKDPWNIKYYKDAFMLHDTTQAADLYANWGLFNPDLLRIRNYLGEKVAFSLAWRSCWLRWGLLPPALASLLSLVYGACLFLPGTNRNPVFGSTTSNTTSADTSGWEGSALPLGTVLQLVLDNTLTPYYGLFMCLWTAFYLVKWNSVTRALQFEWGVTGYTLQDEHERPAYKGAPLEDIFEYKAPAQDSNRTKCGMLLRTLVSVSVIFLLVAMVVLAFILVLFVKFTVRDALLPGEDQQDATSNYWIFDALFIANVASGTTNAICIQILRQIFNRVAYKLTVFEDHIFETDFERSLTWKLWTMDFVNTHFLNLLVLFFRDLFETRGIFGINPARCNLCTNDDCMTYVCVNVFMIIAIQGVVMPVIKWILFKVRRSDEDGVQGQASSGAQVMGKMIPPDCQQEGQIDEELLERRRDPLRQIQREFRYIKETLPGDTDSQYDRDYGTLLFMLNKMQLYSVVVMYAAACPLAPLLLLGLELGSIYRDRRKYTGHTHNRRPAAQRADGIGYWLSIQKLINTIGVITNAVIIALVSRQGEHLFGINWANFFALTGTQFCDPCDELVKVSTIGMWILCSLLICVLLVYTQFIGSYFDTTSVNLKIAMRREKYKTNKKIRGSPGLSPVYNRGIYQTRTGEPRAGTPTQTRTGEPRAGTPTQTRSRIGTPTSIRSGKSSVSPIRTFQYAKHPAGRSTKL